METIRSVHCHWSVINVVYSNANVERDIVNECVMDMMMSLTEGVVEEEGITVAMETLEAAQRDRKKCINALEGVARIRRTRPLWDRHVCCMPAHTID